MGSGTDVMARARGVLRVTHGEGAVARLVAFVMRLPPAGDAVETRLAVTPSGGGEHWRRTFGTRALDTRQYPEGDDGFAERMGPIEFRFRREPCDGGTIFRQIGAAIVMGPLRARLPRWCAPNVSAREDRTGERSVRIDVLVSLPLVGPILGYAGTMQFDGDDERAQRSEPAERAAKRRASDGVGESDGRRPSDRRCP